MFFGGFLCFYFRTGQLKSGQETGEREGAWHAAKGHGWNRGDQMPDWHSVWQIHKESTRENSGILRLFSCFFERMKERAHEDMRFKQTNKQTNKKIVPATLYTNAQYCKNNRCVDWDVGFMTTWAAFLRCSSCRWWQQDVSMSRLNSASMIATWNQK